MGPGLLPTHQRRAPARHSGQSWPIRLVQGDVCRHTRGNVRPFFRAGIRPQRPRAGRISEECHFVEQLTETSSQENVNVTFPHSRWAGFPPRTPPSSATDTFLSWGATPTAVGKPRGPTLRAERHRSAKPLHGTNQHRCGNRAWGPAPTRFPRNDLITITLKNFPPVLPF